MLKMLPLVAILLISGCGAADRPVVGLHQVSDSEKTRLEKAAEQGDADAAYRLSVYSSFNESERWLQRAVELKHAQAERSLALGIRNGSYSPKGFGTSRQEAVKSLLESSSRSEGNACADLAFAYEEGYFGRPDLTEARAYFLRGAEMGEMLCWEKIAQYLWQGIGGDRDTVSAYYWISLSALCVDPRSVAGQEEWALRESIAQQLALSSLEQQWRRIDDYIGGVRRGNIKVDPAPFLEGMIKKSLSDEGRALADRRDLEHRNELRLKKGG
jgi:hypothetical protein